MEIDRCQCLRVRFTKPNSKGEIFQYIVDKDNREIPYKDLSDMSMNEADKLMQSWAYTTLDLEDSPMFNVTMLKLPDDYYGWIAVSSNGGGFLRKLNDEQFEVYPKLVRPMMNGKPKKRMLIRRKRQ